MKKTEIMNKLTLAAGRASLKLKKSSPEIFLILGIGGTIVSTVMACRATLHIDDVLAESQETIEKIHRVKEEAGSTEIAIKDEQKALAITYAKTGLGLAKLYAPSVIVGTLSISSIMTSHHILKERNTALAAAYIAMDKSFKSYRRRVAERFGDEVEKEIRYNLKEKEFEEVIVDEANGEVTKKPTSVKVTDGTPEKYSPYARCFDEGNRNYHKDSDLNYSFIMIQQSTLNDLFHAKGYMFLNEVYEALGFAPTKQGAVVGWIYDKKNPVGDNFIDFGLSEVNREELHNFLAGYERSVWLDFNVDGPILDLFEAHQTMW